MQINHNCIYFFIMCDCMTTAGVTSCSNKMTSSWLKLVSRKAKVIQVKKLVVLNFLTNLLLVVIKGDASHSDRLFLD